MSDRPTAADFNALFRGSIHGNYDIFTPRSYTDFLKRNDVDRARAIALFEGKRAIAAIAIGERPKRAWFGLIGVHPDHRGRGLSTQLMTAAIERVRASGARRIELEVAQRNAAAIRLASGFGFRACGELLVWTRRARRSATGALDFRTFSEDAVATIARKPSACWQREPCSVARAHRIALVQTAGAYAFVRIQGEYAMLLDAGADDAASARALLHELDARIPYDLTLNNEPADSPLTTALHNSNWRIIEHHLVLVSAVEPAM
jgi:GNAT superfamily N-acetyltransferase